jgi:hypothetical protein
MVAAVKGAIFAETLQGASQGLTLAGAIQHDDDKKIAETIVKNDRTVPG